MRIVPPGHGEPRRPFGPRDPGDAWVVADSGQKYWGRFGAAGLLALDPERGVLLQHRVGWSHYGGTWGIPGGARHQGESAFAGALRESAEEAGVPRDSVTPRLMSVLDRQVWTYSTLVVDVIRPFDPVISDRESLGLAWVPVDEVDSYELHPGFAGSWPRLRALLDVRPVLMVDVSSVTDENLIDAVEHRGVPAGELGLSEDRWFPRIVRVADPDQALARGLVEAAGNPYLTVVGDDEAAGAELVEAGARVNPSGWFGSWL